MARHKRHPRLSVDVPTLEPDAAMLHRLSVLSAASTRTVGTSRSVGLRVAFVATVVASLGATTWAAGALPGVGTPFRHQEVQHAPLMPIASTGDLGSPQSEVTTSGSPAPGLPDDPATPAHGGHMAVTPAPKGHVVLADPAAGRDAHNPGAPHGAPGSTPGVSKALDHGHALALGDHGRHLGHGSQSVHADPHAGGHHPHGAVPGLVSGGHHGHGHHAAGHHGHGDHAAGHHGHHQGHHGGAHQVAHGSDGLHYSRATATH